VTSGNPIYRPGSVSNGTRERRLGRGLSGDLVGIFLNHALSRAKSHRTLMVLRTKPGPLLTLRAQRLLMRVALLNVLHNAVKFSPDRSVLHILCESIEREGAYLSSHLDSRQRSRNRPRRTPARRPFLHQCCSSSNCSTWIWTWSFDRTAHH
jgi:hypothetical protein